ncbi:threonine/serine exporter family protein [Enterococcus faecalis]|uniref:threonine/serine exporter family protein n=1 Tax=Enterococcus faecalis TaxID=1351 RepID=UPI002032C26C|nr:threonine/serine exporter family protein [Enterococcus faecalis]
MARFYCNFFCWRDWVCQLSFYPKVIPSSLPRFIRSRFVIGLLAYLAVHFHLAVNIDNIIIGAVMPLVPGVAITNSFRDILAGHLISGTARGTEAIFIAGSVGLGIALIFKLFM